jgi:hypothetical protein
MINEVSFVGWRDFKGALPDLLGTPKPLISRFSFRGQAHADWPLVSNFDRSFAGPDSERQSKYLAFLSFFRHLNRRLGNAVPEDEVECGAIAQHYGMPTRLLDWTLSPYTAAFFAFYYAKTGRVDSSHVAVWSLDTSGFGAIAESHYFQVVRSKSLHNERIHRQAGKFIAARGELYDLGKYLDDRPHNDPILSRYIIPMRDADEALNDMILMGITPADIYPDFEGVAKYVRLRMAFDGFRL